MKRDKKKQKYSTRISKLNDINNSFLYYGIKRVMLKKERWHRNIRMPHNISATFSNILSLMDGNRFD